MAKDKYVAESGHGYERDKRFYVSCINIVLHPHEADAYVDYLTTLKKEGLAVKIRGDDVLLIGSFIKGHRSDVYVGEFYKYLNLDATADWFNIEAMTAATRNEVGSVKIPENLKPHFKKYSFVFFPKGHRLFFISKSGSDSLSALMLRKFFERVSVHSKLANSGRLTVTIEPQIGTVQELFSLPRLSRIELELSKPNPDDLSGLDAKFKARLQKLNAKKQTVIYTEENDGGLKPDAELLAIAKIAASNGKVEVRGRNESGEIVTESTIETPLAEPVTYNPNVQTQQDALEDAARAMREDMLNG
jgi:hypothetical protein